MCQRSRNWCFTWWGENSDHANGIQGDLSNANAYNKLIGEDYVIIGEEFSEEGWKHHQGYVKFKDAKSFANVKNMLPPGTNIRQCKGTALQNLNYCTKDGNIYLERGNRPKGVVRKDLNDVKSLVKEGKSMRDICEVASSYQAIKMAETLLKYKEMKRTWKPKVLWFWGPTGTGKTHTAMSMAEPEQVWKSGRTLKWWYDYDAHEHVVIDDFRGDFCTFHELLIILDRYPYQVEVKGGHRQLIAKTIIITSCYPPEKIYESREDIGQLLRRIDEIREFQPMSAPHMPLRTVVLVDTDKLAEKKNEPLDKSCANYTTETVDILGAEGGQNGPCAQAQFPSSPLHTTQRSGVILSPDLGRPDNIENCVDLIYENPINELNEWLITNGLM